MDLGSQNAEIPAIIYEEQSNFICEQNLAQYGGSDYSNAIQVERGISLAQAFDIANNNPDIGYFVFTKGYMMVLEVPSDVVFDETKDPLHLVENVKYISDEGEYCEGYARVFQHGDVVFFKNEGKWLGTAPGLADVYVKAQK